MRASILLSLFLFLTAETVCQELSAIHVYEYENYWDSIPILDTTLVESRHFNRSGKETRMNRYKSGKIMQAELYFADTLRYVYLQDPEIDVSQRIEYRQDEYGNCLSITSSRDTMIYSLTYKDTLCIRSTCQSGCNYIEDFSYNALGLPTKMVQTFSDGKAYTTTWVYDEHNRKTKWSTDLGNTLITWNYDQDSNLENEIWSDLNGLEEREKMIRYQNSHRQTIKEDIYLYGKLRSRRIYRYSYF